MSEKLSFPGPLRPIDQSAAEKASALALVSKRHRAVVRYHDHAEPIQRMLNAVEPTSYVRPHRHGDPAKLEVFLVLAGRARVLTFNDAGELVTVQPMAAGGPVWGVEIPPGVWHSLLSDQVGTVLYELIEGPFQPTTHKDYAAWAPPEGAPEAEAFLAGMRAMADRHPGV